MSELTYFTLLSLPVSNHVELPILEKQYRELSKKYHPDKNHSSQDAQRMKILHQSAELNLAYRTLKDPFKRAVYLLKLYGIEVLSESNTHSSDPELLMKILELQEDFQAARGHQVLLETLHTQVHTELLHLWSQIATAFQQVESGNMQALKQAAHTLATVTFYRRLDEELSQALDDLPNDTH